MKKEEKDKQKQKDLIIYGVYIEDKNGNRVDPKTVEIEREDK